MGRTGRVAACAATAAVLLAPASVARAQDSPGRGTGTSSVTGASIALRGAEDISVGLVTMASRATLDRARQGVRLAEGALTAATADLGPAGAHAFPDPPARVSRDDQNPGADRAGQNLALGFTVPGDLPADQLGAANPDVARLVTDLEGVASATVPNGLVAKGSARPLNLEALYNAAGASFSGGSTVDSAEALGGLVAVRGLSVTDQKANAQADVSQGSVRELSVDSVVVLDTNSLLGLLGLDRGEVPLATLAALADALGVPVASEFAGNGSWAGARQTLADARVAVEAQLGVACGALPASVTAALGSAGVSCTGTPADALSQVDALLSALLDAVEDGVRSTAFLTVEGVAGSVQAAANVTPDGVAETSAAATGTIASVKVGGAGCGSVSSDLTTTALSTLEKSWAAVRNACNAAVDAALGALGDAYRGVVDVVPVPVGVQTTRVDGDYAVAEARLSLLRAKVTLPGELPDPQDLAAATPPTPTTTTTLPGVTTTTITLPGVTTSTLTLPTLPIAHVRDAAVRPAAVLGTSLTVDVGVLEARAEHTRPGVTITGGGENRTWDARTGFGTPGSLPRTGAGAGAWPILGFSALSAAAVALNRLSRSALRRDQILAR